ncbi:hypothetical protein D3C76_822760 [compost metagenome]
MLSQQMSHPRLIRPCKFEKQLQHRHHQRMSVTQQYRCQRRIGGAPRQTEGQHRLAISISRTQPEVMGMFEHCQGFTAIQLHGELGR